MVFLSLFITRTIYVPSYGEGVVHSVKKSFASFWNTLIRRIIDHLERFQPALSEVTGFRTCAYCDHVAYPWEPHVICDEALDWEASWDYDEDDYSDDEYDDSDYDFDDDWGYEPDFYYDNGIHSEEVDDDYHSRFRRPTDDQN